MVADIKAIRKACKGMGRLNDTRNAVGDTDTNKVLNRIMMSYIRYKTALHILSTCIFILTYDLLSNFLYIFLHYLM